MTITIDIQEIKNLKDVEKFFILLYIDRERFHPETSFHEHIITKDGVTIGPAFTDEEADRLDRLMDDCWDITFTEGVDIFQLAMKCDDMVPWPSQMKKKNDLEKSE